MQDADALWADFARPIVTAEDYIASLRGRRLNVFFMGERVVMLISEWRGQIYGRWMA